MQTIVGSCHHPVPQPNGALGVLGTDQRLTCWKDVGGEGGEGGGRGGEGVGVSPTVILQRDH